MESRPDSELKQIALDILHGLVFTDRHIRKGDDVSMVFMALALLNKKQLKKLEADPPGMIFEYLEKATPRSINGYPCFLSCQMISPKDAEKVMETHKRLREAEEAALAPL